MTSRQAGTAFQVKARERWGAKLPDWVEAVALAADREVAKGGSLATLAKGLKTTASILSGIIGKKHPSIGKPSKALSQVEAAVRGVLMSETLQCPALGMEIGRDACASYQAQRGSTSSPDSFRLARTCPGCPNFIGGKA